MFRLKLAERRRKTLDHHSKLAYFSEFRVLTQLSFPCGNLSHQGTKYALNEESFSTGLIL